MFVEKYKVCRFCHRFIYALAVGFCWMRLTFNLCFCGIVRHMAKRENATQNQRIKRIIKEEHTKKPHTFMTMHADSNIATIKIVKREKTTTLVVETLRNQNACICIHHSNRLNIAITYQQHIPTCECWNMNQKQVSVKKLNVKCETINIKNAMRLA